MAPPTSFAPSSVLLLVATACTALLSHAYHLDNLNLSNRLKAIIEQVKPHLVNGNADVELVSLEPIRVAEVPFTLMDGTYKVHCRNVEVHHLSNYEVKTTKVNEQAKEFVMELYIPFITVIAKFTMESDFFKPGFQAIGIIEANATDCHEKVNLTGKLYRWRDNDYFHISNSSSVTFLVGSATAQVSHVDDKILQYLINSELQLLQTELSETIGSAVAKVLQEEIPKIGNRLLRKIPYKYFISA